jgi:hypothetical protein
MFALSAATKVYLAAGATDLRKGFEGLCAMVEGVLEEAPLSGHVFLFANAARTRLKVLVWEGRREGDQTAGAITPPPGCAHPLRTGQLSPPPPPDISGVSSNCREGNF